MTSKIPDFNDWHPVPVGAAVPAGVPYVIVHSDNYLECMRQGSTNDFEVTTGISEYHTEQPIPAPSDPLVDLIWSWDRSVKVWPGHKDLASEIRNYFKNGGE